MNRSINQRKAKRAPRRAEFEMPRQPMKCGDLPPLLLADAKPWCAAVSAAAGVGPQDARKHPYAVRDLSMMRARHPRSGLRIPKGFRNKAQGCEERATLGWPQPVQPTPTGLRLRHQCGHNPFGVDSSSLRFPRVARPSQPWARWHNPFGIDGKGAGDVWTKDTTDPAHSKRLAPLAKHQPFRAP